MAILDTRNLTVPIVVVRVLEVIFTCISFSLVASIGPFVQSEWIWCMFVWCLGCLVTIIFLVMELSGLSAKVSFWDKLSKGFPFFICVKLLTNSVIYPVYYVVSSADQKGVAASVTSWVAFLLYAAEVFLVYSRPVGPSFLSSLPELLMGVESTVSCVIFISLIPDQYQRYGGLKWCVAVYAICFALPTITYIIFKRRKETQQVPAHKFRVLSRAAMVIMYMTAMVIWPFYSFMDNPKPANCGECYWNKLVVVSVMTGINLVLQITGLVFAMRPDDSGPEPETENVDF